jgi:hypothetical protein
MLLRTACWYRPAWTGRFTRSRFTRGGYLPGDVVSAGQQVSPSRTSEGLAETSPRLISADRRERRPGLPGMRSTWADARVPAGQQVYPSKAGTRISTDSCRTATGSMDGVRQPARSGRSRRRPAPARAPGRGRHGHGRRRRPTACGRRRAVDATVTLGFVSRRRDRQRARPTSRWAVALDPEVRVKRFSLLT